MGATGGDFAGDRSTEFSGGGAKSPSAGAPTGNAGPLRVSVVVVAHTRVQFLKRAVASAANQRPDELLVVKYTHDPDLDRELSELGATVLWTQEPYQGGKVAEGVGHATGDVVLLLDDDDVFLPGKVARVREVFQDPRVVFYSDRFLAFSDTPPAAGSLGPIRLYETGQSRSKSEGPTPAVASCLAARRSMLVPWLADLRGLTIADHTTFMMAVAARKWMAMDQSALTGYHVARIAGSLRPAQSIWSRPGATAAHDIRWMLDLLDSQTDGVRELLNPIVVRAIIHLVFLTNDTQFREYRRTMRAILRGVGVRRPLTIPTLLMFGYPLYPRAAIALNRAWRSLVGFHYNPA